MSTTIQDELGNSTGLRPNRACSGRIKDDNET